MPQSFDPIEPPMMTTTQRNALTIALRAGMLINNITTGTLQRYNGSAWVDVGGASTTPLTVALSSADSGTSPTNSNIMTAAELAARTIIYTGPTGGISYRRIPSAFSGLIVNQTGSPFVPYQITESYSGQSQMNNYTARIYYSDGSNLYFQQVAKYTTP